MTWHIAQIMAASERRAAAEVRRRGHRAYLPKRAILRIHGRGKNREEHVRLRPLMVGYLFVRFNGAYDDLWDCPNIRQVLKDADGMPYTIPDKIVATIMRGQRALGYDDDDARAYRSAIRAGQRATVERAIAESMFQTGQLCLVVSGPFIDKEVTVASITNAGMVEGRVGDMLGKGITKLFHPLTEIVPIARLTLAEQSEAA